MRTDEADERRALPTGHTRTLTWDVTDLRNPRLVHEFFSEETVSLPFIIANRANQLNQPAMVTLIQKACAAGDRPQSVRAARLRVPVQLLFGPAGHEDRAGLLASPGRLL